MSFPNSGFGFHTFGPWALLLAVAPFCAGPASAALVRTASGPLVAEHSGQCLDIGRIAAAPDAVAQWDCQGPTQQQWTIQRRAGAFQIINAKTRQCLTVSGDTPVENAAVVKAACSSPGSFWNVIVSGNTLKFVARSSNLCATVQAASRSRGTALILSQCTGDGSQRYAVGGGFVASDTPIHLIGQQTGLCAAIPATATATAIQQLRCDPALNTQWTLQAYGANTGNFRIVSGDGGTCLAVDTTDTTTPGMNTGPRVIKTACSGQRAELWMPQAFIATSSYLLKSNLNNTCLDVAGASLTSGTGLVGSTCSATAGTQKWAFAFARQHSVWSNLINVPTVPVGVANLPDGQVLGWSAYDRMNFGGDRKQTYSFVLDPNTGNWTERLITETKHDMFCPGTSNLPDGRILISGGSSSAATSLYDPVQEVWSRRFPTTGNLGGDMNIPRAYQANTVLSDGNVFTLGGSWAGNGVGNRDGELYSVADNAWQRVAGLLLPNESDFIYPDPVEGVYRGDNHMWFFAVGDGWVFHAGPSVQMHWIDTKNPGIENPGRVVAAGARGDDLPSINGNAVLFDTGRILKLGGAPAYMGGLSYKNAYLIDIRKKPAVTVTKLAPTSYGRVFSNTVVLPSGEAFVMGGQTRAQLFTDQYGRLETEMWDSKTQVFNLLDAPIAVARTYHSVGLLLPDARVLSGGGGLCGNCTANHPDVQIFSPPYLFNPDGSTATRPVITQAPARISAGNVVTVSTDSPISDIVLMRLSSTTHTVANDSRRVKLWFVSTAVANRYRATIPADRGVVLPGYYMLFVLNGQGTPSIARTIQIQ